MTFDEVIELVSIDLNDQEAGFEYTRWTHDQLWSYVCEALCDISVRCKDLFTSRCVVKVEPGVTWQTGCGCTVIDRIIGECDADGNITNYLSNPLDIEANTWAGPVNRCPVNPKDYKMTSYTISSVQPDEFKVLPPLPDGVDKWVLVECYKRPQCGDDIPWELVSAVRQWGLYRALSVDAENNPVIIQLAKGHEETYNRLVNALVEERKRRDADNIRAIQKPSTQ